MMIDKTMLVWTIIFQTFTENRRLSQSTLPLNEPRPHFAGKIENVTVNVGREATLECPVNHLGRYKVSKIDNH